MRMLTRDERILLRGSQDAYLARWGDKPAKQKPRHRKLNADRRKRIVDETCALLKAGEPTPFAFEASCRHGIRMGLCLQGWRWAEANAAAAEIVAAALNIIGAKRPTWRQGQPEWTQEGFAPIERTRCIVCGAPLPEGHHKFCSTLCSQVHHARLAVLIKGSEAEVMRIVTRTI